MAAGLPALGFTGAGIAANSLAASMMSWSAVASEGGVPAGGVVATLQSLGELELSPWGGDTTATHPSSLFTIPSPFHRPAQVSKMGILINSILQWGN